MSRDVFIAGAAIEPFGKHRGTATEELGYLAVSRLMATAGLEAGLVDIGFGGSVYGGSLLAQRVLQRVGFRVSPSSLSKMPVPVVLRLSTWPGRRWHRARPTARSRSGRRTCPRSAAEPCR